MFSYCLKSLRETYAPEEYQEIDVDNICTTFLWNNIKSIKDVHELHGAGIYCDSNWLDAKMCTGLKKIMKFQMAKQRWNVEIYAARLKAENFLEGNLLWLDVELGMWKSSGIISLNLC